MTTKNEKIRALIVDDEPLARRGIRQNLRLAPEVEVVGECKNGREAVAALEREKPDLVFLDVQMPVLDGFGVIEALGAENLPPAVVFVTAFDEHAIKAFEVNALDYLLKPIDPERFNKTLERAREQIRNAKNRRLEEKIGTLLDSLDAFRQNSRSPAYHERFVIKEAGRVALVGANEIVWISSEGNYVKLHLKDKSHLLRETMNAIEQRLNPQEFLRLRRSAIVRISEIKEMLPLFNGEFDVVLKNGRRLSTSRHYRKNLDALLKS
jgi:two-component system, LytTR family, response regulator